MSNGNMIIGQSGGPTAAINASLAGVIEGALKNGFEGKIYGMVHGIEGLLKEQLTDLGTKFSDDAERNILAHTPSAYLGSCRFKMPKSSVDSSVYDRVFEIFAKYDIKYFLYIGGNDSMDTVYQLSEYAKLKNHDVKVVGVPKTVDNDLAMTDHTPGFGSAAKFVATAVKEIARDSMVYDTSSVVIVEIMGRNAGWLTASSVLARGDGITAPDFIYLPETPFNADEFLDDIRSRLEKQKVVIVAISEGIKDANGVYVCESSASSGAVDSFGHKYLNGAGRVLEELVRAKLGVKARQRVMDFCMLQRCAAHIASATDLSESVGVGNEAAKAALSGVTGHMVGYVREPGSEYKIKMELMDLSKIANVEQIVPRDWINERGNDVNEKFIAYARPFIIGEAYPEFVDGVPKQAHRE